MRACLQNVVQPRARASAFSIFALFDDLGKGGGPWVIAHLISHTGSRRRAFQLAVVGGWTLGGALNALVGLTLARDERKLQSRNFADQLRSLERTAPRETTVVQMVPLTRAASSDDADATPNALHRRKS